MCQHHILCVVISCVPGGRQGLLASSRKMASQEWAEPASSPKGRRRGAISVQLTSHRGSGMYLLPIGSRRDFYIIPLDKRLLNRILTTAGKMFDSINDCMWHCATKPF
jgi:hypothetical protein